jgi:hypothetical protein
VRSNRTPVQHHASSAHRHTRRRGTHIDAVHLGQQPVAGRIQALEMLLRSTGHPSARTQRRATQQRCSDGTATEVCGNRHASTMSRRGALGSAAARGSARGRSAPLPSALPPASVCAQPRKILSFFRGVHRRALTGPRQNQLSQDSRQKSCATPPRGNGLSLARDECLGLPGRPRVCRRVGNERGCAVARGQRRTGR